ncbi:uncharacterized protein KRP23_13360 [Phytophthora ramorum]|uniref:uncharacterized protein n=1 Tax=Phytophthora ramorum TaxID=164328 RepID=UPI0030987EB5|nr:hypothetical protein KRP23_13360 [Phytophthora ramorum]
MGTSFVDVMRVVTTLSALYMCASPSSAVYRMHRHRDVGNASILPFATLWVCNHIWMLYGYVTDNEFPVLTTYAIGDALSVVFLAVVNAALGLVQVALYGVFHPSRTGAGSLVVPVGSCQSPKDELPFSYSIMELSTPLPISIVKEKLDACSITIAEPCLPEGQR